MPSLIEQIVTEDLLEEARLLAIQLKDIKSHEMELRRKICDVLLEGKDRGTHNFVMHGMRIKSIKGFNISLDKAALEYGYDNLTPEEKALIKFEPKLIGGEYNKSMVDTTELDQYLTVTPASPTLTIELGE